MSTGMLLLIAFAASLAGIVVVPRFPRAWAAFTLAATAAGLAAALPVLMTGADWEWRSAFPVCGEPVSLRLDAVSAVFVSLLCVVGGAGAVYALGYWPDREHPGNARRGRIWWSAILLAMGLVLTLANGLHFLIAWELFALSGYFLIRLDDRWRNVRDAGWLYLASSHVGTMCLFAFFASLAAQTGSWEFGMMRDNAALAPLFWLALAGFGVKAGFMPLHVWLPSAHASAPSHVSAIMSGVAIKMGVYGIVRFSGLLPVPPAAGWVVIGLGSVGAVLGIAFALSQNDFKRLLAYCSVENVGIIMIGVGGALLAAADGSTGSNAAAGALWGRLALAGALLHVWNHGLFKSLLFFGAGSVLHATGTREMSRLGGLWRTMPWTAGLFLLGAIAVSGLPPLNGFVSEWLVYLGLFDATISRGPAAWAAMPAAILLATSGALAMAAFVKAGSIVFLGTPRTKAAVHAHESGAAMRGPMILLAAACIAIGLAPGLAWPLIARAVSSWMHDGMAIAASTPVGALGPVNAAVAVVAVAGAAWLVRVARANGVRRGPTWDCGYASPAARMQYTSGSFGGIAAGWFRLVLVPESWLRRPRGVFPASAIRLERVPEAVLERIIAPIGSVVLGASTAVRRLQHGRLQFYVLYVLAGLVALAGITMIGGAQ